MVNFKNKIWILLFLSVPFVANVLSAQNSSPDSLKTVNLATTKLNWGLALTGKITGQPLRTKDGYVAVTEDGLTIAFNQSGKNLWQKETKGKFSPLLSNGHCGMIYSVSDVDKLSMLRSDGSTVWSSKAGFNITVPPVAGRDGRVFVFGDDNAACFGTKGTLRWSADLKGQSQKIFPIELNDGSLMVFLDATSEDGCSVATTISPFGEKGFYYELPGTISSAVSTSEGAIISFTDGSVFLVTESDGNIYFNWRVMADKKSDSIILYKRTSDTAFILFDRQIVVLNAKTGEKINQFNTFCNTEEIIYAELTLQGIAMATSSKAGCYTDSGTVEWFADFDTRKKIDYVLATDDGHLVLCTKRWVVEAFWIKQQPTAFEKNSFSQILLGDYKNLYDKTAKEKTDRLNRFFNDNQIESTELAFKNGNFGTKEKEWLAALSSEISSIEEDWFQSIAQTQTQKAYFATDLDYAFSLLDLASSTETLQFQKTVASLIHGTTDARRMEKLIHVAGKLAIDPDYLMMSEMERIAQKYNKADTILALICDATVDICSFMGKEAFNSKGRNILTMMLGNKYSNQTRENARNSLEKLRRILAQ